MTNYEAWLVLSAAAAEHMYHIEHTYDLERENIMQRHYELMERAMTRLDELFGNPQTTQWIEQMNPDPNH